MAQHANHQLIILWDLDTPEQPALVAQTQAIIDAVAAETAPKEAPTSTWQINLLISDDVAIQHLNKQFRGKDKPTNVLAFPDHSTSPEGRLALGDIIVSYETCKQEAEAQSKEIYDHLLHLIVHGMVHLMGYDHLEDAEAEEMEALEALILARLNISNPYNT